MIAASSPNPSATKLKPVEVVPAKSDSNETHPMDPKRRVTQEDVAKLAGCNRATVSLALRGIPSIPKKTRQKISNIAHRLGYAPDPMLSALATYRNRSRQQGFHGTLVWLAQSAPDYRWREVPHFTDYLVGAEARASTHGYRIEVFDVSEMKISWERAATIALARGVQGVLVCPQPHADTHLDRFPWDKFSAITFGYSLTQPLLHSITSAHFRAMMRVILELRTRGYRRIGCAVRPAHDHRLDHNLLAGYLTGCEINRLPALPICTDDGHETDGHELLAWIKREKPDALVTGNHDPLEMFKRWNISIPRDLGVACPTLPKTFRGQSGVLEQNRLIGEVAVDQLVAMIQRGERGVPRSPQRVLVDGEWLAGQTIREGIAPAPGSTATEPRLASVLL